MHPEPVEIVPDQKDTSDPLTVGFVSILYSIQAYAQVDSEVIPSFHPNVARVFAAASSFMNPGILFHSADVKYTPEYLYGVQSQISLPPEVSVVPPPSP